MSKNPTSVTILGATGTIGQNALKVIQANAGAFSVEAVTAGKNAKGLAEAAIVCGAKFAAIADETAYGELKELLAGTDIEAAAGEKAVCEAAQRPSDVVLAGIVGAAGLMPTIKAVQRGATIALANKECLICAGEIFMKMVKAHGAKLLPVDSEHNGIFQILQAGKKDIESITLTASGGPFRTFSLAEMLEVTPGQAINHPNWNMGAKISVDSATMVNKGLELIEAHHIFDVAAEKLKVLVHPESIIHGLVSYKDGSVMAQLSAPDMRIPIAHALGWPNRIESGVKPIDLATINQLHFDEPDLGRFPALTSALSALEAGGSAPTVLNAANEVAVDAFLQANITFLDIASVIDATLEIMENQPMTTIDDVKHIDRAARLAAHKSITKILLGSA